MADHVTAVGTTSDRLVRTEARPSSQILRAPHSPLLRGVAALTPLAVAIGLWAYSLATYRLASTGLWGLFASVSILFPVGIVLMVVGFAWELMRRRPSAVVLGLYLFALVIVIHATVPLLFSHEPEYQWVYKHIGIIQDFKANGHVTDSSNIYQEWPSLFAAIAGISSSTGVSPFTIAIWSPLGFELLDCLVLLAVFRVLTRDVRVSFLGVLLFESINAWVGQDYLSPEALAYLLWFGVVLLVVRYLCWQPVVRAARAQAGWLRRRFAALRGLLTRGVTLPEFDRTADRRGAIAATIVVFAVIVAAHQLAPYVGLLSIGALTVVGVVRPRWLIVVLGAMTLGFLVPRYGLISSQYGGLLSSFNIFQNATVHSAQIAGSPAEELSARLVDAVSILTWLATVAIVLGSIRSLGRVLIPAVLAFSPFIILFGQSYGGEAPNRVFLFSVPWCAFLIAQTIIRLRRPSLRAVTIVVAIALMLAAGLQGLYAPLKVDTFTTAEITGSEWVYSHMPKHSTLITPDEDFPDPDVANTDTLSVLPFPTDDSRRTVELTNGNVAALDSWLRSLRLGHTFLVTSRGESDWALYYRTPRAALTLGSSLRHAAGWKVFYSNPDVTVFEFRPKAAV